MVEPNELFLKHYYEESILDSLELIRWITRMENKEYVRIREENNKERGISDLCGLILEDNRREVGRLRERVENDRIQLKKLS